MPWIPAIVWHWNKLGVRIKPPKNKIVKFKLSFYILVRLKAFFKKKKDKNKYEPKRKGNPSVHLYMSEKG